MLNSLRVQTTNVQYHEKTSISANADGPRDAASSKIDHTALPTKYNYQATSVG